MPATLIRAVSSTRNPAKPGRFRQPAWLPYLTHIVRKDTQSAENVSATSLAANKPGDLADGHVIFGAVSVGFGPVTITPPSGSWVQIAVINSTVLTVGLFYLPVTNAAGEPATYTWTQSGAVQRMTVAHTGYEGVDPSTIQDATATSLVATGTSLAVPSLQTVTDRAMLISVCGNDSAGSVLSVPALMVPVFQSTGTGKRLAVADEAFGPAGMTGTRTWGQPSSLSMAGILAVMRPSSGASATNAPAEAATGTGASLDAQAAVAAPAEAALGTGLASDAQTDAAINAGLASGTGIAPDPTPAVGANAEAATGTGIAPDPTVSTANATSAPAEVASGIGSAPDPTPAVAVNAEAASGTGTGLDALGGTGAQAGAASGTGAALDPLPAIVVNAEAALGTGSAPDATVSTAAATNAPAEAATGTGTALDATVVIAVNAGVASGTGAAFDAAALIGREAPAEAATGTGTAPTPTIAIAVPAGLATGTGTALDPVVFIPPPVPPPRWVEQAAAATGLREGAGGQSGQAELVGAASGIVEGTGGT